MKKPHILVSAMLIMSFAMAQRLNAQTLYTYNNDELGAVGTIASGASATDLSLVNGPTSINACPAGFNSKNWSLSAGAFTTTYSAGQFTITPDAGVELTITSMSFDLRRNPQGPTRMRYAYSIDGGFSWVNNGSDYTVPSNNCNEGVNFTWDMVDFTSTTAVIFRIYGWDANNVNGQQQLRNGVINGSACSTTAPSISPTGLAISCKGEPVEFSTPACVGCTYQWYKNDNVLSGVTGTSYSTTKPAYYNVKVTQASGCVGYSDHTLLNIGFNPNANIYYPNGLNLCSPDPGKNIIVKVGFLETNTYQWYLDGSEYMGDGTNSWRIFPSVAGNYRCSITSIDGCNRVTDIATVINSCREASDITSELEVYPNPASSMVNIAMNLNSDLITADVLVVNMLGDVISSQNVALTNGLLNTSISLQNATSGVYFVKVLAGGNSYNKQVVVNK